MAIYIRRREFVAALGTTAAWPLVASAKDAARLYRLGFLIPIGRESPAIAAFFDELRLNGFIEGQNLTVIPGGFDVQKEQIAERAAAVVKSAPDAIVSGATLHTRALQELTQKVPLIGMTEDMVAEGLVTSLARPGGNTTGISLLSPELDGKRQDILMEMAPSARRMAMLADSTITSPSHLQELRDAAHRRDVELSDLSAATPEEIVTAIRDAKSSGAEALNFLATPLFFVYRCLIIEHVAASRLPAIYQWPEMAEDGGLAGYGPNFAQLWRQRARLVIKVLRGANPAELPVEQPTTFELVINLKSAKAIGYEVPAGLVLRGDRVIE